MEKTVENSQLLRLARIYKWGTYGKDGKQPLKWVKYIDLEPDHIEAILESQPAQTLDREIIVIGHGTTTHRAVFRFLLASKPDFSKVRPKLSNGKVVLVAKESVQEVPAKHPYEGKVLLVEAPYTGRRGTYYTSFEVVKVRDDGKCWESKNGSYWTASEYRVVEVLGDIPEEK